MGTYRCPNEKCLRHIDRIKILKQDKKTKKKWLVLTCPVCNYESDLEEYKKDYKLFDD